MSELARTERPAEPPPGRIPGEGCIPLESTAGNAQLGLPSRVQALVDGVRAPRRRARGAGDDWPWGARFGPRDEVPASGVYDVVDGEGRYLEHQVTCHEGTRFPVATHEELLKAIGGDPYFYELSYRATHLARAEMSPPDPSRVYRPGEEVPVSGVYNVVDRKGNYRSHQRAWVKGKDRFGSTKDPEGYGYVLAYRAVHLHPG